MTRPIARVEAGMPSGTRILQHVGLDVLAARDAARG